MSSYGSFGDPFLPVTPENCDQLDDAAVVAGRTLWISLLNPRRG